MKQFFSLGRVILLGVVLAGLLTACSSVPVRDAYTAAGDGTKPSDLKKTSTFAADDDLNVVVKLNAHNRTLALSAVFTAPTGETFNTDPLDADATVGDVVLGLDWEARASVLWPGGEWKVDIYVDEAREKELHFTVALSSTTTTPPG